MEATKNFEMIKDFIEKHADDFDKHKLAEYGGGALTLISAFGAAKVLRTLLLGAVIAGTAKLVYDHFAKEADVEAA